MNTTRRDMWGYAFMASGSALLLAWIIPTYSPEYPGYGVPATLVPNVAVGFILGLALLGLARGLWLKRKGHCTAVTANEAAAEAPPVAWLHLLCFFIPCAVLMPAMSTLGFIPSGLVFMLIIQWLCGQRKPWVLLLVALIPVLSLYALMRFGLGIPMP